MIGNRSVSSATYALVNRLRLFRVVVALNILLVLAIGSQAFAQGSAVLSEEQVAEEAQAVWDSGAVLSALELLDRGIHDHPEAFVLHLLRGDILSTIRDFKEAVQAYDRALATKPTALDVHWAKWGLLARWGRGDEAVAELQSIARIDASNPLIHLKLAQELRKADHLEESVESYRQAVELAPDLLDWRLALARARFDVLDYAGAEAEIRSVLELAPPRSPLELSAKNQLAQLHGSMERGRRFTPVLTPGTTAAQLKEWASLRADAWRLFAAGRYREAEPLYRRLLVLNERDPLAAYHLGLTLMQLKRCEEALTVFGKVVHLDADEEHAADAMFRMGQCLVELKQWDEAFVHFQVLYDAAVEFEEANKDVALPAGMPVLSKEKLANWIERVRPHLSEEARREIESMKAARPQGADLPNGEEEDALYAKAVERVEPQSVMGDGGSLMGRDADFSWFRFVIPAGKVVRDDFPTGAHDFIPLNAGDTFPATQSEIYLVFGLVSPSYDAVSLAARCSIELGESELGRSWQGARHVIAQDQVMTATNDQSGYFMLTPPQGGWPPGLYRCGLFAGEGVNAYTLVDEVRFRLVATRVSPDPDGK